MPRKKKLSRRRAERALNRASLVTRGLSAGIIGAGALTTALGHPEGVIILIPTGAQVALGSELALRKLRKNLKKTGHLELKLKKVI